MIDEASTVRIYDLNGKLVLSQRLTGARTTVTAEDLAAGLYVVTVQGREATASVKLIVR